MLDPKHKAAALEHLNEIAPDTFDEGEFGPWTFSDLTRQGDTWVLSFSNREGRDSVSFVSAHDCVEGPHDSIKSAWFDALSDAIIVWEGDQSDEGGDGDDEDEGDDDEEA